MLKKVNRLKKKKDFEMVAKKGRTAASPFLVMKFLGNEQEATRIGFVVSKKISNKAVVRNKVKRRIRESIRDILPDIKTGYDIVFFTRQGVEKQEFREIEKAVRDLLAKAHLINN